ncbi:uncharacterized protein LOC129323060 isoform X2 [Prosopis cineraria]|uniref:uncharacterized protein LOC129323060 isoform X2 n=1 Tax=Prosopis cineraria TaxID=364024 RepID=UPI00240FA3C8|nr:uncharacterized protein LOC129323060 isoform X2 [Prosopis cineraria]
MAEETAPGQPLPPTVSSHIEAEETARGQPIPPTYLEVTCKSSGKTRRFAAGIDAGSAVSLINRKLKSRSARALHIEAVKEGEEPIAFGPNSVLVDYGDGWKLLTFTEADEVLIENNFEPVPLPIPMRTPVSGGLPPRRKVSKPISFLYLVKIVLAFIFIFALGAILTLALENLPALILLVKSSI